MMSKATFGAGCFWCVEAVFKELRGVESVLPGYMGGSNPNPTYEQVCSGTSGHAEVIHIDYNEEEVSFAELLEVFFQVHDPTTLNRQGADVGTQYRSAIFFHSENQQKTAVELIRSLDESKAFSNPIVTELSPASPFYKAEQYHHDYYANNPNKGYCAMVVRPKLEKFRQVFNKRLKD